MTDAERIERLENRVSEMQRELKKLQKENSLMFDDWLLEHAGDEVPTEED